MYEGLESTSTSTLSVLRTLTLDQRQAVTRFITAHLDRDLFTLAMITNDDVRETAYLRGKRDSLRSLLSSLDSALSGKSRFNSEPSTLFVDRMNAVMNSLSNQSEVTHE